MLALSAAIVIAATTPPPPVSPHPAAVQPAAPLREITFRVSYTRHEELTVGHYGAVPPDPIIANSGDRGTLTVWVMAVAPSGLGVKVSENWQSRRVPAVYAGSVINDGQLLFGTESLSEVAEALLPFFAPRFTGDQALDEGSRWVTNWSGVGASVQTSYVVERADGAVLTLHETRVVQMKGAKGMNLTDDGTVRYKPSRLVPVSGSFSMRSERMGIDSFDVRNTVVNFERISDSRDP
jgi:hypothetical protein